MGGGIHEADRVQRLVIGGLLIVLTVSGLEGSSEWTRWLALLVQLELFATGLAGWCPFYWSLNRLRRS